MEQRGEKSQASAIWPDGTWHRIDDPIPENWHELMQKGGGFIIKEED
jgi:hypothetical protein